MKFLRILLILRRSIISNVIDLDGIVKCFMRILLINSFLLISGLSLSSCPGSYKELISFTKIAEELIIIFPLRYFISHRHVQSAVSFSMLYPILFSSVESKIIHLLHLLV